MEASPGIAIAPVWFGTTEVTRAARWRSTTRTSRAWALATRRRRRSREVRRNENRHRPHLRPANGSTTGSKLPMDLWFDRHTHVLSREVLANGPLVTTTTFAGYRRVGGGLFPFSVQAAGSDGNTSIDKVTRVVLDPAGADAQLRRPASSVHDFSIANGATSTTIPLRCTRIMCTST